MRQSNARNVLLGHDSAELDRKRSLQRGSIKQDPIGIGAASQSTAPASMAHSLAMHLSSSRNDTLFKSTPSLLELANAECDKDDKNDTNDNNSNDKKQFKSPPATQ